ncbi:MAG: PAS domain-containing protein [Pseudomonadota bacterium]
MDLNELHPNTQTLIASWSRIVQSKAGTQNLPDPERHPQIIPSLFVIEQDHGAGWVFRNVGAAIEDLLARDLQGHNYRSLWTEADRPMVDTFLSTVQRIGEPGILTARATVLDGNCITTEICHIPLFGETKDAPGADRLLCLYQTIGSASPLNHRPIWRHELISAQPPKTRRPSIRLVVSND